MSEDRRKMNKQSTGTVPKVKAKNNTHEIERDSPRSWTNNLAADFHRLNPSDYRRNSRGNFPGRCSMNMSTIEQPYLNPTANGFATPNTSNSTSRRNSSGTVPKCDNLTKYPDKKQIEAKLSQIREYLQITTSLMSSMKTSDDQLNDGAEMNNLAQMLRDLKDSETKLVNILMNIDDSQDPEADEGENYPGTSLSNHRRSDLEDKIEHTNREMELLRDQQMAFFTLQQKAENKMKDARQIQDKLLMAQYGNEMNNATSQRDKNLGSVQDFDAAIRELEERSKRLNEPRGSTTNLQDKLTTEMDSLQSQIAHLHNLNEDRNQLIHVLDNRDSELRIQHQELQSKLTELQSKKSHIDQLVSHLQNMDEGGEDDVNVQVRRIVAMKDQLSKLKDMLELVKNTEAAVQNSNEDEMGCDICIKPDNVSERALSQHESNVATRYDKQVNKNAISYDRHGATPKGTANKPTVQAELEAKKRELEEIMGKHKASTSNLNHDVGSTDNKSEFSTSSNAFFDGGPGWGPMMNEHNRFESSDSEECPEVVNEYSDHHDQSFVMPILNSPRTKQMKSRSDHGDSLHVRRDRLGSLPRTPERRSNSAADGRVRRRSNSEQDTRNQVQKQLELIRSVCDSMIEQQIPVQHLRNNLTPTSFYSEPRRFTSPGHLATESFLPSDAAAYQGWLAANTLQTQAFMLNTMNQCCQMLWLQQRELSMLRHSVDQLQERMEGMESPTQGAGRPKGGNQVAGACSMPNLNHYNVNLDQHNNMHSARMIDPACLNNANEHINGSVLHANINQMSGQMWNGQALNNQVAPGNRANNYWDNFRSYSRQNLLSTKSNEGLQNISTADRANNPFAVISLSKSNSDQIPLQEISSARRSPLVRNSDSRNNSAVPPDVLNVNMAKTERGTLKESDPNLCYHHSNTGLPCNELNASISEEQICKDFRSEGASRRNEWHEDQIEESHTKSKLFEELREHVYKEVVTLISANETRPHFLIQLFRDLQMISSDPLRLKILQSIQTVISHSLVSSTHHQVADPQPADPILPDGSFSLQSTVWSKSLKNPSVASRNIALHPDNDVIELHGVIKEIIPYLNDHEDEVIGHPLVASLNQCFSESQTFQQVVRDSVFKRHFSNVLDEVLTQYHGKKVRDVKLHVIQSINDLLRGELSFIQLIQDTCPENCDGVEVALDPPAVSNGPDGLQNGDLAEADQGRTEEDGVEEEGAVGGFWDLQLETPVVTTEEVSVEIQNNAESQTQFIKQGLDQVPTRLPTKSRSNTPSKD